MPDILLVTPRPARLVELASALAQREDVSLRWAASGQEAITAASGKPPHLAVLDEDLGETNPWDLLAGLAAVSARINTALVSGLSEDDFHQASAGLGVLTQLPIRPQALDAEMLLTRLNAIMISLGQDWQDRSSTEITPKKTDSAA